jgi:hypothetical protein
MREFRVQAVHTIFESKVLVKKHDQLFIFGHGNNHKQGDVDGHEFREYKTKGFESMNLIKIENRHSSIKLTLEN